MANRIETSSPEFHALFVETNLETHLALLVHKDENISDFKEKLRKEHKQVFPEIGEINISALKIKRRRQLYRCADSMNVCKAFDGISRDWFMYIDAVRVEKDQSLAIMAAEENGLVLEKKNETEVDSVVLDGYNKDLNLEVVEKNTRKRPLKSDARKSRKKHCVVNSPSEKVDDILTGAVGKDIEGGEKNDISMGDNQEKLPAVNSELVDGDTRGEVKDLQAKHTLNEALETEFASWKSKGSDESHKSSENVAIEQGSIDLEKGEKTADIFMVDQEKYLAPTLKRVDGQITSRDDVNESHVVSGEVQVGVASEHCVIVPKEKLDKDIERGEGIILAPSAADIIQTSELVTNPDNQLEVSSCLTTGPATEKKRKRKKSSTDLIIQSSAAAVTTTSKEIIYEINEVPGNVDCVDATSKSCPVSEGETLGNSLVERIQKEAEMAEKSVKDVGRDNIETDHLLSQQENHLKANIELTTSTVTEKKKRRKKSSKDIISQSDATATTASREVVKEINEVPRNADRVDATSESCPISQRGDLGKENVMGEKINEDVGIVKTIPSSAENNIQIDNLVSNPENHLEVSSGLINGPATKKKLKTKESARKIQRVSGSIDHVDTTSESVPENQLEVSSGLITGPATEKKIKTKKSAKNIVNHESIDHVDTTSESVPHTRGNKLADTLVDAIQNGNEMGDNVEKVGSKETILISADKIQAGLVQESKTLDQIGKFTDENTSHEHEVSKEKVEIDADQAKSMKSIKKKSSRKAKTPAKEDTLVASGAQNAETIKVVEEKGPDGVIRDVLDSLQQTNETEENLEKTAKKSSKSSKKKRSLNILEAQVVDSLQERNETAENLDKTAEKSSKSSKKKNSLNIVEAQVVDSLQERSETKENLDKTAKKSSKSSKKEHSLNIVEAQVIDSLQERNETEENLDESGKKSTKRSKKKHSPNTVDTQVLSVEVNNASFTPAKKDTESDALKTSIEVADNTEDKNSSKQIQKDNADMGDNFGSSQKDNIVSGGNKQDQVISVAKSKKEKKSKVQPASSDTSQLQSKVKNDRSGSKVEHSNAFLKAAVNNNKKEAVKKSLSSVTVNNKKEALKKSSNSVTVNKSKTNFFTNADKWHSEDEKESETSSNVSTKSPSGSTYGDSSSDDSDVTSMSKNKGNNLAGGTNGFSGSFLDILKSSRSYKTAKLTASQSQPDEFDELDFVPDSQAN